MLNIFENYDKKYPDLVMDILNYFDLGHGNESIDKKNVLKFCERYPKKDDGTFTINPQIVTRICDKLSSKYLMERITVSSLGIKNVYIFNSTKISNWKESKNRWNFFYNASVYGMECIYNYYKDIVVPIVTYDENDDQHLGTGFKFLGGIVTAKHCIEDSKHIAIEGYSAQELFDRDICVSEKYPDLDIAFIDLGRPDKKEIFMDEGKVLQEILVIGYPTIPTFKNFITVEKATISAIAKMRLTPTRGTIAANAEQLFSKNELMLITAKIRGGNSGGPVINDEGSIIGVSCQQPLYSENTGNYDDLGYGVAVPIKHLYDISSKDKKIIEVKKDFFKNFE